MAVISAQKIHEGTDKVIWLWEAVTNADTCEPVNSHRFDDPTLYVFGTMASASVALHASPEVITAPTLYSACTSSGTAIALTTTGSNKVVDQCANYFKPVPTGGTGTQDIDIYLVIR